MRSSSLGLRGGTPLLAFLLVALASADARAAGEREDPAFFQAVVDGRRRAQDAFRRAAEREALDAHEDRRAREEEADQRRRVRDAESAAPGPAGRSGSPDATREAPPFPWTLIMLGGVAILALVVLRPR